MSLLHKDTTLTKIFVGGLPYHTTDDTLRKFFERFGEIEEAVVITDRQTGKSRGYGFVTMSTQEAASLATREPNPVIDGRKANVNLAYLGAKPRAIPTAAGLIPLHLPGAYSATLPTTYGIQPLYYPQSATSTASTALLTQASTQTTSTPTYYELAYTTPTNLEQASYIYTTPSGQTYSYATLATQQQTFPTDIYSTKYILDDPNALIERDSHQRSTAGW